MKHYNKTRNIKRKLKHMTRRIKKGRTSRLLFKSKVLGKQLRKLSKKFIQRGGLQQRGGVNPEIYQIPKSVYTGKLPDNLIMKISTTRLGGKTKVWDDKTKEALNNISFNPEELEVGAPMFTGNTPGEINRVDTPGATPRTTSQPSETGSPMFTGSSKPEDPTPRSWSGSTPTDQPLATTAK